MADAGGLNPPGPLGRAGSSPASGTEVSRQGEEMTQLQILQVIAGSLLLINAVLSVVLNDNYISGFLFIVSSTIFFSLAFFS